MAAKGSADAPGPGQSGGRLLHGLHIVATPIGAARDITLRALDILRDADVLAAEDTRTLRHLMEIHGIPLGGRPLVACHEHNTAASVPRLLAALAEGRSVAYCSEAGTPLVSDPGYELARAAREAGHPVTAAPGPSAVLAALVVAGLPTDRFLFAGFPPAQGGARARFLDGIAREQATVVLYESPRRVKDLLSDLRDRCGDGRQVAVCRELTKRFEEVVRGPLAQVAERLAAAEARGEYVVVLDRAPEVQVSTETVESALRAALARSSARDAVAEVAEAFGRPRREVYALALRLSEG